MTDLTMSQFASKDDLIAAQSSRIAELEAEVDAERHHHGIRNASAVRTLHALGYSWRGNDAWQPPAEQGKCLHQIAEPAAPLEKEIDDAIAALIRAALVEGGCSVERVIEAREQTRKREEELRTLLSSAQSGEQAPFMYAIADGYGNAFFEEQGCVSSEAKDLQPEVDGLNENLDGEPPYKVVAVYTLPAQLTAVQTTKVVEALEMLENGALNVAENAKNRGDDYDVGYAQAMAKMARDTLDVLSAPAHPAEGVPALEVYLEELAQLGYQFKDGRMIPPDHVGELLAIVQSAPCCCQFGTCETKAARQCRMKSEIAATHPTQQGLDAQTEAARSVLAERARQVAAEGWTPERDDEYTRGILGEAGGIYALHAFDPRRAKEVPEGWPWDDAWWKPKDPRTNLVKAGALILAEIERMDRSFAAQAKQGAQA